MNHPKQKLPQLETIWCVPDALWEILERILAFYDLYIDEDSQDRDLLRALRARSIDVMTVKETKTEGLY